MNAVDGYLLNVAAGCARSIARQVEERGIKPTPELVASLIADAYAQLVSEAARDEVLARLLPLVESELVVPQVSEFVQ